jgi:hypothetical protein
MAIDMNDVEVWVMNYKYSTSDLKNCLGIHFIRAVDNESIEQLQDRIYAEVEAENTKKHGDFNLLSGSISPHRMKKK